jgi:hypothetical protein
VYEPITVEVDSAYGEGNYRSYSINFIGRLIRIVDAGHTKMTLGIRRREVSGAYPELVPTR